MGRFYHQAIAHQAKKNQIRHSFDNKLLVDVVYNKLKQQKRCFNP
jgi:hypothetical protein